MIGPDMFGAHIPTPAPGLEKAISIRAVSGAILSQRFTSVKLTGTGDTPISAAIFYDADDVPLSVLRNLPLGVEFSIMTAEASAAGNPEYFTPAPIARIDFITEVAAPVLVVEGVFFGARVTSAGGITLSELEDSRLTGVGGLFILGGGACGTEQDAWVVARDIGGTAVTDALPEGTINGAQPGGVYFTPTTDPDTTLVLTTVAEFPALVDTGDYYPLFGVDKVSKRVSYGIVNTTYGKRLRGDK